MYGQVHVCIRSLILEKFGKDTWTKVLEKSACDPIEHFLTFSKYEDAITLALIGAVSEVLGVPVESVLEIFGEYFFTYCLEHGYDKMLRTLGDNISTFIQNLDSLHALLSMSYKNIDAPSFRCEPLPDGNLILHYYSSRKGLFPIVIGLVRAVGRELYDQQVSMNPLEMGEETLTEGRTVSHVVFEVKIEPRTPTAMEAKAGTSATELVPVAASLAESHSLQFLPSMSLISPVMFNQIFPFHVVFDKSLIIKQCGERISNSCRHATWAEGTLSLGDLFELVQPQMPLTFQHILRFCNATYILELRNPSLRPTERNGIAKKPQRLTLKGQMVSLGDIDHMLFIGSPRLSSLNDLVERNLYLSDIPLYDVTRELVLLNQQRLAELDVSKKLDETTAELKRTSQALETEKAKTDVLLYQMLPINVANQLREGKRADAEKFEQVTVLFSDIVTFTNIAAAVQPIQVVRMLNELYSRFDHLTSVHGVYKVETIGDAYMVVGGIPEASVTHATAVADFSIDMVNKAIEVLSPATGKPLQIRVGIHSGPVVAGVVGDKMPRYCLFGDTVNTASRMESHGQPGKIHLSPTTHGHISMHDYAFETRGEIEVKGKGLMMTYFLLGKSENMLSDPASEQAENAPHEVRTRCNTIGGNNPDASVTDSNQTNTRVHKKHVESVSKLCSVM